MSRRTLTWSLCLSVALSAGAFAATLEQSPAQPNDRAVADEPLLPRSTEEQPPATMTEAELRAQVARVRALEEQAAAAARRAQRADARLRIASAARLQKLGVDLNWHLFTLEQLHDAELRVAEARAISRRFATDLDWRRHSLEDLRTARRQLELGQKLPPQLADDGDGVLAPSFRNWVRVARRANPYDPDAVLPPTGGPIRRPRPGIARDPDEVLPPTLSPWMATVKANGSDPDAPLPPRL